MLAGWTLVMVLFAVFVTKLGFSWYLMAMIAVASLAVERRLAAHRDRPFVCVFLSKRVG